MRQRGYLLKEDLFEGLFGLAIVGYGIALVLANQAVQYFQFGQPALLYIVPLMIFPVLWRAHLDGNLDLLWERLPLPRTVAVPLGSEEHRRLLNGDRDILAATASWGNSTGQLNIKVKGRKRNNVAKMQSDGGEEAAAAGAPPGPSPRDI